jgi:hypothetical protein
LENVSAEVSGFTNISVHGIKIMYCLRRLVMILYLD